MKKQGGWGNKERLGLSEPGSLEKKLQSEGRRLTGAHVSEWVLCLVLRA